MAVAATQPDENGDELDWLLGGPAPWGGGASPACAVTGALRSLSRGWAGPVGGGGGGLEGEDSDDLAAACWAAADEFDSAWCSG